MPQVVVILDVQQISDTSEIVSDNTCVGPISAGNALATVRSSDSVNLITLHTTAMDDTI